MITDGEAFAPKVRRWLPPGGGQNCCLTDSFSCQFICCPTDSLKLGQRVICLPPFSCQVVRVMTAAMEGSVSVGVDWGVPTDATALPQHATSANVRPGDVARLYAAWLPLALQKVCGACRHADQVSHGLTAPPQ